MQENRLLPERLNAEPCIFRGCSASELGMLVLASVIIWLPLCTLIAAVFGAISMGLGLAGVAVVASVIAGSTVLQKLKRGRPDGYYQHRLALYLDRLGLRKSHFICREGHWSLGYTRGER